MKRHSVSRTFVIGYLIFGILSFVLIATFTANMSYNRVLDEQAADLRQTATRVADSAGSFFRGTADPSDPFFT